jgi:hypothetical protein
MRRLDDFVPANHPLRRIRVMVTPLWRLVMFAPWANDLAK